MGPNITRRTTAISTNFIASICRTSIRRWAEFRPIIWRSPLPGGVARPEFTPQSAYIHPRVTGDMVRYFEWMGAARHTADKRSGSMHGKQFLMDGVYAGIDEKYVYGRLDFAGKVPEDPFEVVVNVESWANHGADPRRDLRLDVAVERGRIQSWKVTKARWRSAGKVNRRRMRMSRHAWRLRATLNFACR